MRQSDLQDARGLRLFQSMSEKSFETMMQAAFDQSFPAHVELLREGEAPDFLYVVVDGCVELYARSNERESTTAMVQPVNAFILAAVLRDAVALMSARTLQRSRMLMIPAASIRQAVDDDAAFARAVVIELADTYRSVIKEHKSLKLRTAVERLANRLLCFDRDQGGGGRIELPYDKRTLASLLAMTPENLSRAFNTLGPYGVKVRGATILITDRQALTVLAKPNPLIDDPQT